MSASLKSLDRLVEIAVQEVDIAIATWEAARPANNSHALLSRLTGTYEANTFLAVRSALNAQTAMALSRLWDSRADSAGFSQIHHRLSSPNIQNLILGRYRVSIVDRYHQVQLVGCEDDPTQDESLRAFLSRRIPEEQKVASDTATRNIADWLASFLHYKDHHISKELSKLRSYRNRRMAHRALDHLSVEPVNLREIGRVLRASEILTQKLLLVVQRSELRFLDSHRVHADHAETFWSFVAESPRKRPVIRTGRFRGNGRL